MLEENLESPEIEEIQAFKGVNPKLGFVRKVYGILSFQCLFTAAFVYLSHTKWKSFFEVGLYGENPWASSLVWLACIGTTITMVSITCYTQLAVTVPTNYILLGIFTLCETYTVAYATSFFDPEDIILAAVLTITLTLTLTLYALVTKHDFTVYGGLLWILGWSITAVVCVRFGIMDKTHPAYHFWNVIVLVCAVAIYGFYLLFDTMLIMEGGDFGLSLDDYIIAAILIYVDMIILFLRILAIVAALSRRN